MQQYALVAQEIELFSLFHLFISVFKARIFLRKHLNVLIEHMFHFYINSSSPINLLFYLIRHPSCIMGSIFTSASYGRSFPNSTWTYYISCFSWNHHYVPSTVSWKGCSGSLDVGHLLWLTWKELEWR